MPAIMPPINPNFIAALGQYFGGMQNRTIRTPPFVKPGSTAERGAQLGTPAAPTPGLVKGWPTAPGSAAPTAPSVAPPPRSLGEDLSRIPTQPTLTPTPRAAAAGEQHPGAHLDPNAAVPKGFEERKWEHDGTRELTSPQGTRYEYDQSGDLIGVYKTYADGTDTAAPSLPDSTAPAAAQGAAPKPGEVIEGGGGTVPAGAEQFSAPDITPEGGTAWFDDKGVYVKDKEGRLIRSMPRKKYGPDEKYNPPAPAGGGQAPASMPQKKGGIWSRLTDPSLAGIALAAGQQLTRPRYPGETATGNAVNAVTAGYNTLAQQRQMQVAREEAARKAALEEREQKRKEQDTTSEAGQRTAQGKRWEDMSADERRKARADAAKAVLDQAERDRAAGFKGREVTTGEKNAESLKVSREAQARTDEQRVAALETQVDIAKQDLQARIKENATDNERADAELKVHQGILALNQAKEQRDARKSMDEKFLPYYIEASNDIGGQERNEATAAAAAGKPYVIDPQEHKRRVDSRAIDLINKNQAIGTRGNTPAGAPPPWAKDTDYWDQTTNEVKRQGPDGKWYAVPPPRR